MDHQLTKPFLNKHVSNVKGSFFLPDCESNAVINAFENELVKAVSERPQPQAHHITWQPSFLGQHMVTATFIVPRDRKSVV